VTAAEPQCGASRRVILSAPPPLLSGNLLVMRVPCALRLLALHIQLIDCICDNFGNVMKKSGYRLKTSATTITRGHRWVVETCVVVGLFNVQASLCILLKGKKKEPQSIFLLIQSRLYFFPVFAQNAKQKYFFGVHLSFFLSWVSKTQPNHWTKFGEHPISTDTTKKKIFLACCRFSFKSVQWWW